MLATIPVECPACFALNVILLDWVKLASATLASVSDAIATVSITVTLRRALLVCTSNRAASVAGVARAAREMQRGGFRLTLVGSTESSAPELTVGHQPHLPNSASTAGSSTGRASRTSRRTATAAPIPNARRLIRSVVVNGMSAAIMTSPAPVAAAPVSRRPMRTAGLLPWPATYASRVRIKSSAEYVTVTPNATVEDPDDRHRVEVAGAAERWVRATEQGLEHAEAGCGDQQAQGGRHGRKEQCTQREREHER